MQKARNIINATGFLNMVGDREHEPKKLSGPTLFKNIGDALPSCANQRALTIIGSLKIKNPLNSKS